MCSLPTYACTSIIHLILDVYSLGPYKPKSIKAKAYRYGKFTPLQYYQRLDLSLRKGLSRVNVVV